MKFIKTLGCFLLISLCLNCTKQKTIAPEEIENRSLVGKVTSGTGLFSDLVNYQFTTKFTDRNFQTKTDTGSIESEGTYTYQKVDSKTGVLVLHLPGKDLQITLKFTSTNTGVYKGHLLSDETNEQTGLFDLK